MSSVVRFAPSPSGFLHLGNIRMAILNYLLAKKIGAKFLLRIDDTNIANTKEEYIRGIKEDLTWLGIIWDDCFQQSTRLHLYTEFLDKLIKDELVYPCYETPTELKYKKNLQLELKKPPIYDRNMLQLTQQQKQEYVKEGRKPHYRLKLAPQLIKWHDLIKGNLVFDTQYISDPIVVREDGTFLYLLTSALDDINYNISHVIRGEDHIVNTAIQIQIFQYLKHSLPNFAHLPLIKTTKGEGLSKRLGSASIKDLKKQGIMPLAINQYLVQLGLTEKNILYNNTEELIQNFELEKYNGAATILDMQKLFQLNLLVLQKKSFSEIQSLTKSIFNITINKEFWDLVKYNIEHFADIKLWYNILFNAEFKIPYDEKHHLLAEQILIFINNNDNFTINLIDYLKKDNPKKDLFTKIRYLLTGLLAGPLLSELIPHISREIMLNRLTLFLKSHE